MAKARSATAVIAYNIVLFITVVILEGDFNTADQGLDHGVGTLLDITEETDFRIKRVEMVERAVKGMLPQNKLGRAEYKKLFVYADEHYEQEAQKPTKLEIK